MTRTSPPPAAAAAAARTPILLVLAAFASATAWCVPAARGGAVRVGAFTIDPQTLETTADRPGGNGGRGPLPVSAGQPGLGAVRDLSATPTAARWTLGASRVACRTDDRGRLSVRFEVDAPRAVTWPVARGGDAWVVPFFEGVCIPSADARWLAFLARNDGLSATEALSFPAWGVRVGDATVTYLLPEPFACDLGFAAGEVRLTRTFTPAWKAKGHEVLVEVGGDSLVEPALAYRRWAKANGRFVSLKEKIAATPKAERLLGAAHVYLWGDAAVAPDDVTDWGRLAAALSAPKADAKPEAKPDDAKPGVNADAARWYADRLGPDARKAVAEMATGGAGPAGGGHPFNRRTVTDDLSRLSRQAEAPPLAAAFAGCLSDRPWGDGVSVKMVEALRAAGLDRLVLTLGSLTAAAAHPDAVRRADEAGYLLGPYDSYNTMHAPGSEDAGETTQFDAALWRDGAVVRADGTKRPGFQKKGFTVSSRAVEPYVARRVDPLLAAAPYSSWFVDCDAFGEYFDDFSPARPGTQADDLAARRRRLAWLAADRKLVVGSEGGSALMADRVCFGHGVTTPVIGWGDPDLADKRSPHFLGAYWPPEGPAIFVKPAVMKDEYAYLYEDPRFRVPLYEAAFHDSVVATHHWTAGSLKFSNVAGTVALFELLQSTPPMYHLNPAEWRKHKAEILAQYAAFSPLHRATATLPLAKFERLSADGLLQRTTFGGDAEGGGNQSGGHRAAAAGTTGGPVTVTVNFAAESRDGVPGRTARIELPGRPAVLRTVGLDGPVDNAAGRP